MSDLPFFVLQVIPNYSTLADYDRMFALGVTMYGQMTAGSYCFIGPQGIVHGTTVGVEWMGVGRGRGLDELGGRKEGRAMEEGGRVWKSSVDLLKAACCCLLT